MLQESALVRLQHMCDAVVVLEAFREDSGIARLLSDANRCHTLMHKPQCPASMQVSEHFIVHVRVMIRSVIFMDAVA